MTRNNDNDYQNVLYDDDQMSPEVENSYIQQNLPIRRQSLIAYHDKLRAESEQEVEERAQPRKRHSSLNFTCLYGREKQHNSRLYNSKSLTAINDLSSTDLQQDCVKNRSKHPSLSIQTNQPIAHNGLSINTTNVSASSSASSNYSPFEFSMDTLFEEQQLDLQEPSRQQQQQPQKQQTVPRFKGLLRPSKSDTIGLYNNSKRSNERNQNQNQKKNATTDDINASNSLSQSWNEMSQPLSRLRNVFSRLQPTTPGTSERSKRMPSPNKDLHKKKKSAPSIKTDIKSSSSGRSRKKKSAAMTYTALLSHVSSDFLRKIQLTTIALKDGIQYYDVFNGAEAVGCILEILNTSDRNLALVMGRALESQGLFHHVNFDYRLRDLDTELYQFKYLQQENTPHYDDKAPILPQYTNPSTSNRLLSLKKPGRRHVPSVCETLPINGVFSVLTDCYSPTCTKKSPCYSISCPRMMPKKKKSVQRPLSSHFLRTEQEKHLRSLWRHSVPPNIVLGTNSIEQKRQECIYELIYTEEDFTKDMHYVQDFWIEPLSANDIIPIERRAEFITDVFWNFADIERISTALTKDLTLRQDKHTVIPCIGDIMLKHVEGFEPFVIYGAHQIIGKHKYELEKRRNTKFLQFAENLERQPESRRLELNGYLTKPTSRLGRYNLLLNTIHQLTPKDHQDYDDIPKAMDKITEYLVQLNEKAGMSDNTFHLEQISSRILTKGQSLELLDPKRQLLMRGKMKRCTQNTTKNNSSLVIECTSVDIQLFLFDHYLVFCKIKHQDGTDYYKIYQKPIPLESLFVSIPHSVIIPSSTSVAATKSNIYTKISSSASPDGTTSKCNHYPITFQNADHSVTLTASTESTRKLWLDKISEYQAKYCQQCNSHIESDK